MSMRHQRHRHRREARAFGVQRGTGLVLAGIARGLGKEFGQRLTLRPAHDLGAERHQARMVGCAHRGLRHRQQLGLIGPWFGQVLDALRMAAEQALQHKKLGCFRRAIDR
jgi:hypothetical protein